MGENFFPPENEVSLYRSVALPPLVLPRLFLPLPPAPLLCSLLDKVNSLTEQVVIFSTPHFFPLSPGAQGVPLPVYTPLGFRQEVKQKHLSFNGEEGGSWNGPRP